MQVQNKVLENTIIPNTELCYWELSQNTSYWTTAFINQLGYDLDDITVKLEFFLNEIIHPDYKASFKDNFFNVVRHNVAFRQNLMVKSKKGKYLEYVCMTDEVLDKQHGKPNSNNIYFFKSKLNTHEKVRDSNFYYLETADMTNTGSWYIDFEKKKSYWDNITRKILEYPLDFIPSLKMALNLYAQEHHDLASHSFFECAASGKPFDLEIKMVTANKRKFWARAKGKPVFNDNKEIVGVRGVFQDIDDVKQKEVEIKRTSAIIASQNSRLYNFAHIVSHNLRSHSSNLSLVTQLIDDIEDVNEKLELLGNLKQVSESLDTTICHLNEVVTVYSKSHKTKEKVNFEDTIKRVCTSINQTIFNSNANISSELQVKDINYIPAYLDSIILNLITNAIKYKHPDKSPEIIMKTSVSKTDESRVIFEISDNGLGIDLKKFGDNVFGMYKTFHYNKDATGIGLFMTRNQIESLNGTIEVNSKVNLGTTFKITF